MSDATVEFFERLGRSGHEPLLAKASGTARFDLEGGKRTEYWVIAIKHGDVAVSRKKVAADCVIHMDRALFDQMAAGEANAMAALQRGQCVIQGNPELLVMFQRLFPGPPGSRGRAEPIAAAEVSR
jgi:putative sterol carrier protein